MNEIHVQQISCFGLPPHVTFTMDPWGVPAPVRGTAAWFIMTSKLYRLDEHNRNGMLSVFVAWKGVRGGRAVQEIMSWKTVSLFLYYEPHCCSQQLVNNVAVLQDMKCRNQRRLLNELCGLFEQVTIICFIRILWRCEQMNYSFYWDPTVYCKLQETQ